MKKAIPKNNIALALAILFHTCGATGILFSSYRQWFINSTPINLLLMFVLLIWTQPKKNYSFYFFAFSVIVIGYLAELVGVHTGLLFGHYAYGNVLGPLLARVPLLIGINWFITVYGVCTTASVLYDWLTTRYSRAGELPKILKRISFAADAALLATLFDWIIEPAAVKLGFWSWLDGGRIPALNYVSWFLLSAVLAVLFRLLPFPRHNYFAVHLFCIQVLFFLALNTFL